MSRNITRSIVRSKVTRARNKDIRASVEVAHNERRRRNQRPWGFLRRGNDVNKKNDIETRVEKMPNRVIISCMCIICRLFASPIYENERIWWRMLSSDQLSLILALVFGA